VPGGNQWRRISASSILLPNSYKPEPGVGTSFYGYDWHGSVRLRRTRPGRLPDRYDYDAFGTSHSGVHSRSFTCMLGNRAIRIWAFTTCAHDNLRQSTGRVPGPGQRRVNLTPDALHKYTSPVLQPVVRVDPSDNSRPSFPSLEIASLMSLRR